MKKPNRKNCLALFMMISLGVIFSDSSPAQASLIGDTVQGCVYSQGGSCNIENHFAENGNPGFVEAVVGNTGSSPPFDAEFQPFDSQFGGLFADFSANQLTITAATQGAAFFPARTWEFSDLDWRNPAGSIIGIVDLGGDLPISNLSFTSNSLKFDTPDITFSVPTGPASGAFQSRSQTIQFQTQAVVGPNTPRDLDGNGTSDLVWRNTIDGNTAIWLLNGTGIAASGFPGGVPQAWQIADIGDVNGDGKADVIWRNSSSGTVAIWLMNGLNITSVGFPGSTSTDWTIQAVGDVNGDGQADLVWRNTNSGVVAIWLMNGASIASSGFLGGVPQAWQIAGMGDVDADGKADVIWRNSTSGTVAVWLMNGLTIASVGFPGSASTDFQIAGVGDVDGDGQADLVWRNTGSGAVALWLLNGAAMGPTGFLTGLSSEWQIAQVGDANGDGKADAIWYNTTSGSVMCWLLNGLSIASTIFPGNVSTDWIIAGQPSRPAAPPLSITTAPIFPSGTVGQPFNASIEVTGGIRPYSWSLVSGLLPPGLTLNPSTGQISGTPTTAGHFVATIQVQDGGNPLQSARELFSFTFHTSSSIPPPGTGGGTLTITGAPAAVKGTFVAELEHASSQFISTHKYGGVAWSEIEINDPPQIPHLEGLTILFDYETGMVALTGVIFVTSDAQGWWGCTGSFIAPGLPLTNGTCEGVAVNRPGGTVTFSSTVLENPAESHPPITLNGTLTFPPF